MMPENIVQMTFQRVQTVVVADNLGGGSSPTLEKRLQKAEGINVLGAIVRSVAFGIALSRLGPRAKPAMDVVAVIEAAVMQLMDLVIW
ncbi:excitatory amino acid transporter [Aphelenchoides avenae]|nr:excitatory amino acid transporter [Aphelenchus avenae]